MTEEQPKEVPNPKLKPQPKTLRVVIKRKEAEVTKEDSEEAEEDKKEVQEDKKKRNGSHALTLED